MLHFSGYWQEKIMYAVNGPMKKKMDTSLLQAATKIAFIFFSANSIALEKLLHCSLNRQI